MRVGCSERTALKQVYYQGWNRSPAQVGCIRQVLRTGALGRPRGMGWRGRQDGGSGWGTHVNPWLIRVNVWEKPRQNCKVISLQLIKKKKPYLFRRHSMGKGSDNPNAHWARKQSSLFLFLSLLLYYSAYLNSLSSLLSVSHFNYFEDEKTSLSTKNPLTDDEKCA